MTKKPNDKKIGAVDSSTKTTGVKATESLSEIASVKPTSSVGAVKGASAVSKRRPTRIMSANEREDLFKMINEEADKLFGAGNLSDEKRAVLKNAVKMAVDTGLIEENTLKKK